MRVAYLGPKGTFSEEAAIKYYKGTEIELIMYNTIIDVLEAVSEGEVEKGIVPIENAIEGTITMTTDGLTNYDVWVEGEAVLPINLHLLANKGAKLADIKEVFSIPPALAQCRTFTKGLGVEAKQASSTANAAQKIKESGRMDAGAIASEWAAQTFDLQSVSSNIQDFEGNRTRFLIVAGRSEDEKFVDKAMLLVSPREDRPGLLASMLNVFSSLEINLTWIESRPTKRKLGTYRFFFETSSKTNEKDLQTAVKILETYGYDVRVLGSFTAKQL